MKKTLLGLLAVMLSLSSLFSSGAGELFSSGSAEQIISTLMFGGSWAGETSPLFLAAQENKDPEVLRSLIALGHDPFERGEDGRTLLMAAAKNNPSSEVIKALLDAGLGIDEIGRASCRERV